MIEDEAEIPLEICPDGVERPVNRFDKFRIGKPYVFYFEIPVESLSVEVPASAHDWGVVVLEPAELDADGNEIKAAVTRQKTLDEFALRHEIIGDTAIVQACAKMQPTMRPTCFGLKDALQWEHFLWQVFKISFDDLILHDSFLERIKGGIRNV